MDYQSMKVTDLRDILTRRNLPTTGKKSDIISRLIDYDASNAIGNSSANIKDASIHSPCVSDEVKIGGEGVKEGNQPGSVSGSTGESNNSNGASNCNGPNCHRIGNNNTCSSISRNGPTSATEISKPKPLTADDILAKRKERFGIQDNNDKLVNRAKRFGLTTRELEEDKKLQRAKRFGLSEETTGMSNSTNSLSASRIRAELNAPVTSEELERRRKRAERFGTIDEDEKKKKRSERFGVGDENYKRQKRLERFGLKKIAT